MSEHARVARRRVIGVTHLGLALAITADIVLAYALAVFLLHRADYPAVALNAAAWGILIVTVIIAQVALARRADRLPRWTFVVYLTALGVVVALDVWGAWGLSSQLAYPTAAAATGGALLIVVMARRARDILLATAVLAATLATTLAAAVRSDILTLAVDMMVLAFSIAPPLLGVGIVRAFRILIQLEVDRAQVQSAVTAPAFAIGMLASEELARLDLDAEKLLDDVTTGRTPLPLDPETAAGAASLATELRLHLIEGRRETWLYHAIAESAFLGPAVALTDPHGLAGLLDSSQRDGLLSAVWLLVSEPVRPGQGVHLVIGLDKTSRDEARRGLRIPIVISTTGIPQNRVDPATWDAVRRVGRFVESPRGASFRVDIQCRVDNPVD